MKHRIHPAALALAADGTVLVNVAHIAKDQDPSALLRQAIAEGGNIFVGVQLSTREVREATKWSENAATEATGHIVGARNRKRRRRP